MVGLPAVTPFTSYNSQNSFDATLSGEFIWGGRKQEVLFGVDSSRWKNDNWLTVHTLAGSPFNPYAFDPSAYAEPAATPFDLGVIQPSTVKSRGVFGSIKLRPMDGLALTLGARKNYADSDTRSIVTLGAMTLQDTRAAGDVPSATSPYVGVVYQLSPVYSVYASYASNSGGIDAALPSLTASGGVLGPPRGTNQELGIKAAWGRFNGSVAVFDIDKTNVPAQDPSTPNLPGTNCCSIATTERSKGLEVEVSGALAAGWQMSGGYTFNINRAGDGTSLSTITPKHLFKLWTNYRLPGVARNWDVGGGITAQSRNYREGEACTGYNFSTGECSAQGPFNVEQGFYSITSVRAGYRFNNSWSMSLSVNNLFDRRYYQSVGVPATGNWYGTPRNWMIALRGEI